MVTNVESSDLVVRWRPRQSWLLPDSHNAFSIPPGHACAGGLRSGLRKCWAARQLAKSQERDCTIFGHRPVDELHSIENKGNKIA